MTNHGVRALTRADEVRMVEQIIKRGEDQYGARFNPSALLAVLEE